MIGAMAGVIGGLIYLLVGVPIAYFTGAAAMEDAFARSGVQVPISGPLLFLVAGLVGAIFLIVLSVIGGLIAIPIFEKRKDGIPPSPPPQEYPG